MATQDDELIESIAMFIEFLLTSNKPHQPEISYSYTILELLLKTKHGDRRAAHQLEARACEFGERPLLHIAIILTSTSNLSFEESHNLQQLFDALLPLLGDIVRPCVGAIIDILIPCLASADTVDNEIGRKVVSSLTGHVGLDFMMEMVASDVFGDKEQFRRRAVQVLAAVASSAGIAPIVSFLWNVCSEPSTAIARETGFKAVQQIAMLNRHDLIPHLDELVQIAVQELSDSGSNGGAVQSAALAMDIMAKAVHPYGEYCFRPVMWKIFRCMRSQLAWNQFKSAEACAKAIESIVDLTEEPTKSAYAKELMEVLYSEARGKEMGGTTAVRCSEISGEMADVVEFDELVMKMSRLCSSS